MPYLIYFGSYDTISTTGKVFMSLSLNSGMGIAMHILSQLEGTGMSTHRDSDVDFVNHVYRRWSQLVDTDTTG
jgi:hypothetical protein